MNLVDRAKNIILTPKTEWPVIAAEQPNTMQIVTGYVIPLAAIAFVAQVIGYGLIGFGPLSSFSYGLGMGLIAFISAVAGVYIMAYVIDFLAPNFGSEKNFGRAFQLVAYSYTPAWVAGILHIIPVLGVLVLIASIYGLYLMYLGMPVMMKTPQDKVIPYLVVSIIVIIVVTFLLTLILSPIILGLFGVGALTHGAF
jgi:hypothetical protein